MRWLRGKKDDEADEPQGTPPEDGELDDRTVAEDTPTDAADADLDDPVAEEPPAPVVATPTHIPIHEPTVDETDLKRAIRRSVARALAEDLGDRGDVTSLSVLEPGLQGTARVVARQDGVIAGTTTVVEVFGQVDARVDVQLAVADGDRVTRGATIATVSGPLRSILTAERTALNFLGHLSGIATTTRTYVDAVEGTGVAVRDTRKTTPGLRLLEKAAVAAAGGANHRLGLYDAILLKDNHIAAVGDLRTAVSAARDRAGATYVQVEVTSVAELEVALDAGATDVMLDNFSVEQVRHAVQLTAGRARLEASGGITLDNIAGYAKAGVDRVAVGAVTHSATNLDVALDVESSEAYAPVTAPTPRSEAASRDAADVEAVAASGALLDDAAPEAATDPLVESDQAQAAGPAADTAEAQTESDEVASPEVAAEPEADSAPSSDAGASSEPDPVAPVDGEPTAALPDESFEVAPEGSPEPEDGPDEDTVAALAPMLDLEDVDTAMFDEDGEVFSEAATRPAPPLAVRRSAPAEPDPATEEVPEPEVAEATAPTPSEPEAASQPDHEPDSDDDPDDEPEDQSEAGAGTREAEREADLADAAAVAAAALSDEPGPNDTAEVPPVPPRAPGEGLFARHPRAQEGN